ncbi:MAG TPA: hypothetical protein PLS67_02160 [Accumulibacter sp.]|nr:hypothetical protein [Accumulibacter sp.]HQC79310.1 hypothetical protein [Accumulibacter sp.]
MSTYSWKGMDAGLLTVAAKLARNETLTAAEEYGVAEFLRGYRGGDNEGFPGGPVGDVRGDNNLRRSNWFNGRYLTAEALSRQDTYFDARSRLNAHALMPGIAWGLGVEADGANALPVLESTARTKGLSASSEIRLRRGLAFDHIGRPILVSRECRFTIEQLIGTYRKTPQRVVGGGVEFMPCVCLTPDPSGPTGGGPAVPSGPYLLVIEAGESPEGGAKVMGDVCGGAPPSTCQTDAWRGAFGLSLVRFPVELPLRDDLRTAWDLRGTLSAYYFDVFEHPLWKRWDPNFLSDGGFCADSGPGRHDAGAIALAMLYLGEDGTVLFLDPWMVRRTICDTPGEDWHRTRFGAPPRAAAWARIHQFQCMLAESLRRLKSNQEGANLHRRGFRHLPPIGFLPIRPRAVELDDYRATGIDTLDSLLYKTGQGARWLVSPLVKSAIDQAEAYFEDTGVITYAVVALHDDDILEDLANVFDKDPLQLTRRTVAQDPVGANEAAAAPAKMNLYQVGALGSQVSALPGYLGVLARLFEEMGLDDLVNRRTEIVKLIVPLQGLTRRHPLVGALGEDAMTQAPAWGVDPLLTAGGALGPFGALTPQTGELAGLVAKIGLDMLPRHFVVYVKQRLVLLDVLFYLLEILQFLFTFFSAIQGLTTNSKKILKTEELRARYLSQPAEKRAIVEALLAQPEIQASLARAADLSDSGIAVTSRNQAFLAQVQTAEAALENTVADPAERRQIAVGRVADAYAAEYPDYQLVQVLAAVQPRQTLAVVNQLAVNRAVEKKMTLADELSAGGPAVFADADALPVYSELRAALDARKVSDYVSGVDSTLTAKELLARSPDEARQLLGADNYEKFRVAFQTDRNTAVAGAQALAQGVPDALAVKVEAGIKAGTSAETVIETLKNDTATSSAARPLLDHTASLLRITGGKTGFLGVLKRT